MSSHFQQLLAKANLVTPSSGVPIERERTPPISSKQISTMPMKYVQLSLGYSRSGMTREDGVPERIEGAIAPQSLVAIPGKLVKMHLANADIRYMSGMYVGSECRKFIDQLAMHKSRHRWDRLGKGRSVIQWSNPAGIRYVFSDTEYIAEGFPDFAQKILARVVEVLRPIYGAEKTQFNYCVCNCYANGFSGVNWHTDAETHLVPDCPIACVSFGSERVFSLAKIPSNVASDIHPDLNVRLESGSMVVMAGETQRHYLHAIAKETAVREARFSLTFRVNYID